MKIPKLASFCVLISLLLSISSATASELFYCRTFWLDSERFLSAPLLKASNRDDCRERPIPLHLSSGNGEINARLEIYRTIPATPDYLILDLNKRSGELDIEKFVSSKKEIKEFKKYRLDNFSLQPSIEVIDQADGILVLSEVSFLNSLGDAKYMVANYTFFKEDRFSIFYFSGILRKDDKLEMDLLDNLRKTFKTMKFGW